MPDMDPYSTAKPLFGPLPQWIADKQEQQRIAAYQLYEQIYWGVPQTFKLQARGEENQPIYIPAAKTIVETMNRFVAPKVQFTVDPAFGTPNDQLLATQVMTDLVRREKLYSKFSSNKRYGIIRGDWMFHLYADPARPEGSRLSVFPIDPASVFPIYNPQNIDEIIGYHIAEQFIANDGKTKIRRLTYRKTTGTGGPSPISVEDNVYDVDKWGGPGMDPEDPPVQTDLTLLPTSILPSPIEQLPIYHIQNFTEPGMIWGSSELRGIERVLSAINQSVSDEEMALAMEGLGVYASDAGTPVDDDGNEVPWDLGPGRVVELPEGKQMLRVSGVTHVTPYQDHLAYLHDRIDQVFGISAVAKGKVDVTVAESGIALFLELAPLLAHAEEKDQIVTDVTTNMLFDIPKWYVAYEGGAFNSLVDVTRYVPVYGQKVPTNNAAVVAEALKVAVIPGLVSMAYLRDRLRKHGYEDMPDEATMAAAITTETQASQDAFGARVDQEIEAELTGAPNET